MASMEDSFKKNNRMLPSVIDSSEILKANNYFEKLGGSIESTYNMVALVNKVTSNIQINVDKLGIAYEGVSDNIAEVQKEQDDINNKTSNFSNFLSSAVGSFKNIASAIGISFSVNDIINFADEMQNMTTKIDDINDSLQSTPALQDMIMQSAKRSRSAYADTVDTVVDLGKSAKNSFSSNEDMIAFAELMNKQFKLGGGSIEKQKNATNQLIKAMSQGVLQGDGFTSVMRNAPQLAESLAEEMGVSVESLSTMASQGKITSDVIKNAMYNSASQINDRFNDLPMSFGDIWTFIMNSGIQAFTPIMNKISEITKNENFNILVDNLIGGLVGIASIASGIIGIISTISSFFINNWSVIEPIVVGIAAAMLLYNGAIMANNIIQGINMGIQTAQAIAQAVKTGATVAETAANNKLTVAQWALNSAFLACPLTWIILLIIALIAIFYVVIAVVNKFAATSLSVMGIVMGAFGVAGSFIGNTFMGLLEIALGVVEYWYNTFGAFANFFGNLFNDPIGSIIGLFGDLADTALGFLEKIAEGMDFIFGSNMADTVKGWRGELDSWTRSAIKEYGNGEYKKIVEDLDVDKIIKDMGISIERFDYSDAWQNGYKLGEDIGNKMDFGNILGGLSDDLDSNGVKEKLGDIYEGVEDNAYNSAAMKDSMNESSENLEYLRDIAEQESINRFTTAEIKLDMYNENQISSEVDLDGMVSYLEEKLYESLSIAGEGVYV